MNYEQKYLKYKNKYLDLKQKHLGGSEKSFIELLERDNPEEYEDLFVIKEKDKNNNNMHYKSLSTGLSNMQALPKLDEISTDLKYIPISSIKKNNKVSVDHNDLKKSDILKDIKSEKKNVEPTNLINNEHNNLSGGSKGKKSWKWICNNFERKLNSSQGLSIKISSMSSDWNDGTRASKYAGIIFWHKHERGYISYPNIYSIYVLIQDTTSWSGDNFRRQGEGKVHDYLYEQVTGESFGSTNEYDAACCSGFSYTWSDEVNKWVIKFSSRWLNSNGTWTEIKSCNSNESKMCNVGEAVIIIGAVNYWVNNGPGSYSDLNYIPNEWKENPILQDDYYWITNCDYYHTGNTDNTDPYDPSYWFHGSMFNII
jgi:hypothetical protein